MVASFKFHYRLFDLISPIYQLFFKKQHKYFRSQLDQHQHHLKLHKGSKILDLGCGTGSFAKVFQENGFKVTGIDVAKNMVKLAQRNGIDAKLGNVIEGLQFEQSTFDLVVCSHLLHGFPKQIRNIIYKEIIRISKERVLIHDYNKKRNWGISIIEWLERGDYFNFIKNIPEELEMYFGSIKEIPLEGSSSFYICEKNVN